MRIGIVSINKYVQELNYGSTLQSFALYKWLRDHGYNAEIVDYFPRYRMGINTRYPYLSSVLSRRVRWIYFLNCLALRRKWKDFLLFSRKKLKFSKTKYSYNNFDTSDYDLFVIGSDTVWNSPQTRLEPAFYAEFPCMRMAISYAASFSSGIYTPSECEYFQRALKKFVAVSVREDVNMGAFPSDWRSRVAIVCDPTLLHDRSTYDAIAVPPHGERKYMLYYMLYYEDVDLRRKVDEYATSHGLDVVEVSVAKEYGHVGLLRFICRMFAWSGVGRKMLKRFPDGVINHKMMYGSTIGEWLGLIRGAELVVTNSFHATVFSILFAKNFFNAGRASRAVKLNFICRKLGLGDRNLQPGDDLRDAPIDYEHNVYPQLGAWKKLSEEFLSNALAKAEAQVLSLKR